MGILELKYNNKVYKSKKQILSILTTEKMFWLIDAEMEDAVIEILNNTLIWYSGIWRYGNWRYGIFKNGGFYGVWENGIFEGGYFKGQWKSGIKIE